MADIAAATRAMAELLQAQWRLEGITQCNTPWPPSLHDVTPTPCQLLQDHPGQHRHRVQGTAVVVTW